MVGDAGGAVGVVDGRRRSRLRRGGDGKGDAVPIEMVVVGVGGLVRSVEGDGVGVMVTEGDDESMVRMFTRTFSRSRMDSSVS